MALTVRLTSQDTILAVISPSLPNPFLHLRLSIETVPVWERALITYHRIFFCPTSLSAKIATNQALERQILKTQLEVKVKSDDSEEEDENLALISKVENLTRRMIAQKCADFAFAGVRSEAEFQSKRNQLDCSKAKGLELYFQTDGIRLKKELDCAFYTAIRGQTTILELQALENYWDWMSDHLSWSSHLYHWSTDVEICKRISIEITSVLMALNPRVNPCLKATFGSRLKTDLLNAINCITIKLSCQQRWSKDVRTAYMMYKIELLKGPICRMLLWEKLAPLISPCEEEIQKLSQEKKDKKDPLKSARKEWVNKRKEFDPQELKQVLADNMFTPFDFMIIQALSLSLGHDLKRTLIEQEILDTDIVEDLTVREDPALFLRYQLQMRDEMALRLLSPQE